LNDVVVKLQGIKKIFPGVTALDNVSIELKRGEVHGLIGENGAGKSTLIKVLTGAYIPEEGEIFVEGKKVKFTNPRDARKHGIACVYQELNSLNDMSITDNMFIGNYRKNKNGLLDYNYMNSKAKEIMRSLEQDIDPATLCGTLGMGLKQMVEIGKAILQDARVVILDEPTSSLGEKEVAQLFRTIKMLKEKGVAVLFVSHKLEEVFELCDVVTVMRDSKHIITAPTKSVTRDMLISYMVGRTLDNLYPKIPSKIGDVAIEVKGLTRIGSYYDVSFKAHKGEILGFAGLVGAGRTELFRGVFGADPVDSGEVYVNGVKCNIRGPRQAIKHRMALLTEDRKGEGLILNATVNWNLVMVNLYKYKGKLLLNEKKIIQQCSECIKKLRIKTSSGQQTVSQLSGGNQQKVVIGKWISSDSEIYIFDEPTRGIDVGAKVEVYKIMNELVLQGKCVIMISSELPEVLGMSDRIIVMRRGRITAEIKRDERFFNQEDIMRAAFGEVS